jgi:flagellar basal-body rod modification protein FlgD
MATEATGNAASLQTDYLSLLVTQLQNQDPLSPMDSSEMTGQMSQLYQLQAMESMDANFSAVLASVQQDYATSLVGKEVKYGSEDDDGETTTGTGQVQEVNVGDSSDITLTVGDQTIGLADVISVGN